MEIRAAWINEAQDKDNIVVSSRVRIARNLNDYAFPTKMTAEDSERLRGEVFNSFVGDEEMEAIKMEELSLMEKESLTDQHLISPNFARSGTLAHGFLLNSNGSIAVMVNEEDHLRMQSVRPGLELNTCYDEIAALDKFLESKVDYAYDTQLGYLTSCITNIGTGLRASAMLHLPALKMTGKLAESLNAIGKLGFVARGFYGEGSDSGGDMYQVSNQITLGRSEEEIIISLQNIIQKLIEQEREARQELIAHDKLQICDQLARSLGVLKYSRRIDSNEAMQHLSKLRLGVDLGLIKGLTVQKINLLNYRVQVSGVQEGYQEEFTSAERDYRRAKILRQELEGVEYYD